MTERVDEDKDRQAAGDGPLAGLRVLEFAGLGPVPFCGLLLSDLGAEVVRIDRPGGADYRAEDVESRGRRSIIIDLKSASGRALALSLAERADILLEGFRPGVMERLGLGPDCVLSRQPALVYGRMTGWGQDGPLAAKAGHDLNYLALTGALHALGPKNKPAVPLNLIADFGGGALYLALGVLAALHHARSSGEGQVVDCAMTEGVLSLLGMIWGDFAAGTWRDARESNVIDGAAPFYNVYECADGRWLSVAAIEAPFWRNFLAGAGLEKDPLFQDQWRRENWPAMRDALAARLRQQRRDDWCETFVASDACVTPVLSLAEARACAQHRARQAFVEIDGIPQPAPAPRLSRTPGRIRRGPVAKGSDTEEILADWQIPIEVIKTWRGS